jgi:protein TonB
MESRAAVIRKAHINLLTPKRPDATLVPPAGGDTTMPALEAKVEPAYSAEARAAQSHGQVVLRMVVDTDGKARDISLVEGLGFGLDEAALEAVTEWRFKPATRGGVPVAAPLIIRVSFRLIRPTA